MSRLSTIPLKTGKNAKTKNTETLIREYKQKRWVANSERIGKPDSLSAWYSIEEIEKFIALAKSNGGDGLKFYYGAYPEDYAAKPEYAGRQTLVAVGTKSKKPKSTGIVNKDMYIQVNGQIEILSINFPTAICPPNCNTYSEGGMGDLGITIIDKGQSGMEIV